MMYCRTVSLGLIGALLMVVAAGPAIAEDTAVIKGKVIFKGDPARYKRMRISTEKDPNCRKAKPKGIGTEKVVLNKKTDPITIRNVLVSIKEGVDDRKFPVPAEPVVLDQKGCQYKPHVLGIMAGQELLIRNSDDTNHNIHFLPKVNIELNKTQPKKGMESAVTLVREDPFKIKCDVHPWMGCYIAVFDHPFFDVTDKTGTFAIQNLPPGTYVVQAWHEKFGTTTATVEVATGETREVDLTFEPGK